MPFPPLPARNRPMVSGLAAAPRACWPAAPSVRAASHSPRAPSCGGSGRLVGPADAGPPAQGVQRVGSQQVRSRCGHSPKSPFAPEPAPSEETDPNRRPHGPHDDASAIPLRHRYEYRVSCRVRRRCRITRTRSTELRRNGSCAARTSVGFRPSSIAGGGYPDSLSQLRQHVVRPSGWRDRRPMSR